MQPGVEKISKFRQHGGSGGGTTEGDQRFTTQNQLLQASAKESCSFVNTEFGEMIPEIHNCSTHLCLDVSEFRNFAKNYGKEELL